MGSGMFSGVIGFLFFIFLLFAAILWFLLPFAVFGTKGRLDQLIQTQQQTNRLLEQMQAESAALREALKSTTPP